MNILLVGNLPADGQESMARFGTSLLAGLRARGHRVTLIAPQLRLGRLAKTYRYGGIPKYLGYFDKFVLFPRELRRCIADIRPDVVHLLDQASAVFADPALDVPVLATCHDLLQIRAAQGEFPGQSVGGPGRFYQARVLAGLSRVRHIACVSAKTRADVLRLTHLPAEIVTVVPNALNYPYQPVSAATAQERLAGLAAAQGEFLLHVGGSQWYKNRPGALAIHAELRRLLPTPPALVLVGRAFSPEETAEARSQKHRTSLIRLTGVSNGELEALYTLAQGLLFPSWEEGFGWPIAEAQACGCPVFTSNHAPLTEVGGEAAVYFDPADPAGAARIIADAWPGRLAQRSLGLHEAARWAPELMLSAYEQVYHQLASE